MDPVSTGFSRDRVKGETPAHEKKSGRIIKKKTIRRIFVVRRLIIVFALSGFFHKLSGNRLLFPVEDCGGLLVVFPFFKFPDDAFFFHHPLKTFNGLFQHLVIIYDDMSQMDSPPFLLR
jgi:hypothetical protein